METGQDNLSSVIAVCDTQLCMVAIKIEGLEAKVAGLKNTIDVNNGTVVSAAEEAATAVAFAAASHRHPLKLDQKLPRRIWSGQRMLLKTLMP